MPPRPPGTLAPGSEDVAAALIAQIRAGLQQQLAGRRWMVTADVLPGTVRLVEQVKSLGADAVFALAAGAGAGPLPDADHAVLDLQGGDMMGAIRASQAALEAALPTAIQARIDAFDPAGQARVMRCLFASDAPVGGRRAWGSRPATWRALEDKTIVDALWDVIGVPRAPAQVVAPAGLPAAHAALNAGAGTVWSLDNREGWHGGASGLRWVQRSEDVEGAVQWARDHAHQVRVMPFLEGVPCSIHGVVFADRTIALRPCEMVVLRRPGSLRFAYARAATFWDPPPADRAAMRDVARRVGEHLRATVGYRGVFTVDGILSRDGFRPTELNPRFGAAIGRLSNSLPELPLYLLHLALVEEAREGREGGDWAPAQLERTLIEAADAHRIGGALQVLPARIGESRRLGLVRADRWRPAREGEAPHATVVHGPAPAGSIVFVELVSAHTPVGPMVGPRVAEIFAFLDTHWDLGIGALEAARAVR